MSEFSLWEHKLSDLLSSMPLLKSILKKYYQRLNYIIYAKKSFRFSIANNVSIFPLNTDTLYTKINDTSTGSFVGYYDISPWNTVGNQILFHKKYKFPGDNVQVLVMNLLDSQQSILAESNAWNFQQGTRLQWVTWNNHEQIIFNTTNNNNLGSVLIINSDQKEFCPWPIQAVHPKRKKFISLNYLRLNRLRPEYGYNLDVNNFLKDLSDKNDGLWQIEWPGKIDWFISLNTLKKHIPRQEMACAQHKVNHVSYSPSGNHILFLHRWLGPHGKFSRLYSIDENGDNLRLLLDNRVVSHFNWKNDEELVAWARHDDGRNHYILINAITGSKEILGEGIFDVFGDGHPSFSPCRKYMLTDTYPNRERQRYLLLFALDSLKVCILGKFFEPFSFDGELRCDLHPRWSPDGKYISIDSAFSGIRNTYILDLGSDLTKLFD